MGSGDLGEGARLRMGGDKEQLEHDVRGVKLGEEVM